MTPAVLIILILCLTLRSERVRRFLLQAGAKEFKKHKAVMKGYVGERRVDWLLRRKLDPSSYFIYRDLYVPVGEGFRFSQIDHVVVSRFGVFVVETKNFSGEIYGKEKSGKWFYADTQISFQNPIHQNNGHIKALQEFLGLPAENFHSVVFFVGGNPFRLPLPPNVYNRDVLGSVRKEQVPILGGFQVEGARASLDHLTKTTNKRAAARTHRNNIRRERLIAQNRRRKRLSTSHKNSDRSGEQTNRPV